MDGSASPREILLFDFGWKFFQGHASDPQRDLGFGVSQDDFAKSVSPLLSGTCAQCHNDRVASGGLNVGNLADNASVVQRRADWEKILRRVRAGEMPPAGVTV